jgi:hypothetical protein
MTPLGDEWPVIAWHFYAGGGGLDYLLSEIKIKIGDRVLF